MRAKGLLVVLLMTLAVVGCDSAIIGSGKAPTELKINLSGDASTVPMIECTAEQLIATLIFEDDPDDSADYASRVVWSSSDDSVVSVSNGDLSTGSGTSVYSTGVLVARRPGTATITASYLDGRLLDTADVAVSALSTLTITPDLGTMAPETLRMYTLEGTTATGYPVDGLSSQVAWAFAEASVPADLVASGETVSVTALEGPLDEPFHLEARLDGCGRTLDREISISTPTALRIDTEQGNEHDLPVGLNESLQMIATFADGSEQNVTSGVVYEQLEGASGDVTLTSALTGSVDDRYLLNSDDEDENLQFEFCFDPLDWCLDTPLYHTADLEGSDLRVTPDALTLIYPDEAQLRTFLSFEDGVEREITRSTTFESSNTGAVSVSSGGSSAGEVTSYNVDEDADIEVTASAFTDDALQVQARVYSIEP